MYAYSSKENLIQELAKKVKEFDNKIKIFLQNNVEADIDYYFLEGIVEEGDSIYGEIISELKEIEEKKIVFENRKNWARFGGEISFALVLTSVGLALSTGSVGFVVLESVFLATEILSVHQTKGFEQEIGKFKLKLNI